MISVLMPVRNGEQYLEAAVDSILHQTFRDFELVCVDDGSTDGTSDILARYEARDRRVAVIRCRHMGHAAAANHGLQHCHHPWVARMDGDDVALPTRLERQYAAIQADPEVVVWGTDGYHINSKGEVLSNFRVGPTSKQECRDMRSRGEIVQAIHPSVMFNRDVAIKAGGYDETCALVDDVDLFDRMLRYGDLVTIPEPLIKYRVHSGQLSMANSARKLMLLRYITARQRRRLATNTELTLAEFLLEDERRSRRDRIGDWIDVKSNDLYRRGGMSYGEGQYMKAAWNLTGAFALRPIGNSRRVWMQVFSARARRNVRMHKLEQEGR